MQYVQRNFYLMPNDVFAMDLTPSEFVVYSYLRKCVDNRTYQCWPSYATIGAAANMSKSTVKRCVDSLTEKGFVRTERTHRQAKDGTFLNGSLLYTLPPQQEVLGRFYERQLAELERSAERQRTAEKMRACLAT